MEATKALCEDEIASVGRVLTVLDAEMAACPGMSAVWRDLAIELRVLCGADEQFDRPV
jgi:hypothetical protein